MAALGLDCQVMLDGVGYFVEPHTYAMKRARLRKASVTKGGGERYVDLGPGKREWHMTVLCLNQLTDYSGQALLLNGKALRDALRSSYEKVPAGGVVSLPFIDLDGVSYQVHFDDFEEQVRDPRTQMIAPSYHCPIVLVEA
jgi:hypothetical protein